MPGSEIAGFLLIDKPEGITSFDVISRLRRITGIKRIGHTGTLDPFATGLLICCLGVYTRLAQYLEASVKSYEACLSFGTATDSADKTGILIKQTELPSPDADLAALTRKALDLSSLPVPAYSAIKIDGKRAYKYAREGAAPEMPWREVKISSFEVLSYTPRSMIYRCTVSKGTYIRALSEWIAEELNSSGHSSELRRISIGKTSVESAIPLEDLNPHNWQDRLYNPALLFSDFPSLQASASEILDLHNGKQILNPGADTDQLIITNEEGVILGVAERKAGSIRPVANFKL